MNFAPIAAQLELEISFNEKSNFDYFVVSFTEPEALLKLHVLYRQAAGKLRSIPRYGNI